MGVKKERAEKDTISSCLRAWLGLEVVESDNRHSPGRKGEGKGDLNRTREEGGGKGTLCWTAVSSSGWTEQQVCWEETQNEARKPSAGVAVNPGNLPCSIREDTKSSQQRCKASETCIPQRPPAAEGGRQGRDEHGTPGAERLIRKPVEWPQPEGEKK